MNVEVRELRVERGERCILDIPALSLPSGSVTAVFGPNGSGKTTLLRAIAGLDGSGHAVMVGDAPATSRTARHRVAFAFQEAVFLSGSVRHNLELALDLRRVPAAERRDRIAQVAEECGIGHLLTRDARALSRGEAQRANVARALSLRAPVTLLDEPLAGIDRPTRAALLDELPSLLPRFTTTAVIVTHDRDEAFRLAERIAILLEGRIHATGARGAIYRRPPDAETAELLGYTILRAEGMTLAVPPDGLVPGEGPGSMELVVTGAADVGSHRRVSGRIGDARAELAIPLAAPLPAQGERVRVVARERVVLAG